MPAMHSVSSGTTESARNGDIFLQKQAAFNKIFRGVAFVHQQEDRAVTRMLQACGLPPETYQELLQVLGILQRLMAHGAGDLPGQEPCGASGNR